MSEHDDLARLVEDIRRDPDDQLTWFAICDGLEERGDAARAGAVRAWLESGPRVLWAQLATHPDIEALYPELQFRELTVTRCSFDGLTLRGEDLAMDYTAELQLTSRLDVVASGEWFEAHVTVLVRPEGLVIESVSAGVVNDPADLVDDDVSDYASWSPHP